METVIILTVQHQRTIEDLLEKIAGRAYTLDGVQDVRAELVMDEPEKTQ